MGEKSYGAISHELLVLAGLLYMKDRENNCLETTKLIKIALLVVAKEKLFGKKAKGTITTAANNMQESGISFDQLLELRKDLEAEIKAREDSRE